jgi:hypothetical protein
MELLEIKKDIKTSLQTILLMRQDLQNELIKLDILEKRHYQILKEQNDI